MKVVLAPNDYQKYDAFQTLNAIPVVGSNFDIGQPPELCGAREYTRPSDWLSILGFTVGYRKWIQVPKLKQNPGSCGPAWLFCAPDGGPLPVYVDGNGNENYAAPEIIAIRAAAGDIWIRIERYWVQMEKRGGEDVAVIKGQTLFSSEAPIFKFRCNRCGKILTSSDLYRHPCQLYTMGKLDNEALTIADIPLPARVNQFKEAVMAAQTWAEAGKLRGYEDMF